LYRRLSDVDIAPPEIERLRGVYKKTWYRNQRHRAALIHAVKVLRNAHIETTLVGDMAVALEAYAEFGSRTVEAAQIVVPPESLGRSLDRLIKAGFVSDRRNPLAHFGLPTHLVDRTGGAVDLQSFVYGPGWPDELDRRLQDRRVSTRLDELPLQTLASSDAIAAVVAHGLASPFRRYQCLVDLVLLSRQADAAVDWAGLIERYQHTVLLTPLVDALETLRDQVPEALPPGAAVLLRMHPTRAQRRQFWLHRRDRRFARLPAWYRRATRQPGTDEGVGFTAFVKGVYGVSSTREALLKGRNKIFRT
jgi:hypothetical protein